MVGLQATSALALVFMFVFFWFINTFMRYEVEVERKYEEVGGVVELQATPVSHLWRQHLGRPQGYPPSESHHPKPID